MNDYYEEDRMATKSEACKEFARNYGSTKPDREWILTDYDTWERNPSYTGPRGPHPEDLPNDCYDISGLEVAEKCHPFYGEEPPTEDVEAEPQQFFSPDDIPF